MKIGQLGIGLGNVPLKNNKFLKEKKKEDCIKKQYQAY